MRIPVKGHSRFRTRGDQDSGPDGDQFSPENRNELFGKKCDAQAPDFSEECSQYAARPRDKRTGRSVDLKYTMGERIKVPATTADELLVANAHTCCICQEPRQPVEIHHINGNPGDNRSMNLAVLCRNCHGLVSSRGPLGRSYSASEVQRYKQQWETKCDEAAADGEDGIDEPEDDLYETKLLGANEHEFYRFEMDEGQELIGSIAADAYIDVVVCEEADFEKWRDDEPDDEEDECPLPDHYFLAEDVSERTFRFTASEGGVFGVLVINWGDEDAEVTTEIAIWD